MSAKEVGLDVLPMVKEHNREKKTLTTDVLMDLEKCGYEIYASKQTKILKGMPQINVIDGYIQRDGKGYAVYVLPKKPQKKTIQVIHIEVSKLWQFHVKNAVIFCPSQESIKAYNDVEGLPEKMEELLLIPYPTGIGWLSKTYNISQILGLKMEPSSRLFADYIYKDTYYSDLIYNNSQSRTHKKLYDENTAK